MKTLVITTKDGKGAGATWRGETRGCELEEGKLELGGRERRVFRLLEQWGKTKAGDVVEVLVVPDDVDPRELLEHSNVTRVMSAAAAEKVAAAAEFTWPEITLPEGGGTVPRPVPGIAGGSIPRALEGDGAAAVVSAEKVGELVVEKTAAELGVDMPTDEDLVEATPK